MDHEDPEIDKSNGVVNGDIFDALKEYIVRVCIALINKDSLDTKKLSEALRRPDAVDILKRFISSAESSIVFIEDATSVGGEGSAKYFTFWLYSACQRKIVY